MLLGIIPCKKCGAPSNGCFFGYNPCHLRDPCVDHDFIASESKLNGWRMPDGDDSLMEQP